MKRATSRFKLYDRLFLSLVFATVTFPLTKSALGWIGPVAVWGTALVGVFALLKDPGRGLLRDAVRNPWFIAFVALLLVEIVMLSIHGPEPQLRYVLGRTTLLVLASMTLLYVSRTGFAGLHALQITLIASACLLVLFMFVQMAGLYSLGNETLQGRLYFGLRLPFRKVTGFLMSDGRLGTVLVPAFLLALASIVARGNPYLSDLGRYRVPITLLLFIGIVCTQSRSAYAATLVGLALFAVFVFRSRIYRAVAVALLLSLAIVNGTTVVSGFQSEGTLEANVFNRMVAFEDAYYNWLSAPVSGVGHQNMIVIQDSSGEDKIVHNMFLDQLGATGLVGFLPLAFLFAYLLYALTRSLLSGTGAERAVLTLCLAIQCGILVELNLYRGFYNEYGVIYGAFALSVVLYTRAANRSRATSRSMERTRRARPVHRGRPVGTHRETRETVS